MQPRSTLALPLTIRAWLAKCKLHFAGRLFFRWLTLVTFLLGLVAALALYVSDLGHLRAQFEIRSLLFPNMLSPNILLDHTRSRFKQEKMERLFRDPDRNSQAIPRTR